MTKKIFFLFFCFFIFSEYSIGLQNVLRSNSDLYLSKISHNFYKFFHLPKVFSSDDSRIIKQNPVSELSNNKKVFACPTHDDISKHIFCNDESVRVDILKAFTGIQSLSSATLIDRLDNRFDPILKLRRLINSIESQSIFNRIKNSSKIDIFLDDKKVYHALEFLKGLVVSYEDFSHAFPYHSSHSVIDFLCKTNSGNVTIEFQVSKQDYWDRRILSLLSSLYGNEKAKDYKKIEELVGSYLSGIYSNQRTNIVKLKEDTLCQYTLNTESVYNPRFVRNYIFVDKNISFNKIPVLNFIHYSLSDANIEDKYFEKNQQLKKWVEFFLSAHKRESMPPSIDEPLRKAYEMIRLDVLNKEYPNIPEDKSSHEEKKFFLFIVKHAFPNFQDE